MVADALHRNNWVRELRSTHTITTAHLLEYVQLWELLRDAVRHNDRVDTISWKFSPSVEYSSKSGYKAQFIGSIATPRRFKHLEDVCNAEMQIFRLAYTSEWGLVL